MVSWQEDVQAALDELCRVLFEAHDYYRSWGGSLGSLDAVLAEITT